MYVKSKQWSRSWEVILILAFFVAGNFLWITVLWVVAPWSLVGCYYVHPPSSRYSYTVESIDNRLQHKTTRRHDPSEYRPKFHFREDLKS